MASKSSKCCSCNGHMLCVNAALVCGRGLVSLACHLGPGNVQTSPVKLTLLKRQANEHVVQLSLSTFPKILQQTHYPRHYLLKDLGGELLREYHELPGNYQLRNLHLYWIRWLLTINDSTSWSRLLCFPQCCLQVPIRGKGRVSFASSVNKQIRCDVLIPSSSAAPTTCPRRETTKPKDPLKFLATV